MPINQHESSQFADFAEAAAQVQALIPHGFMLAVIGQLNFDHLTVQRHIAINYPAWAPLARHNEANIAHAEQALAAWQADTVIAPVNGTVQQLAGHTTGDVVTPAQVLQVVPDQAQATAEVTLENKDVGFVNLGQGAEIKLETFPYTRYGTVPAKVTTITADAVMQQPNAAQPDKQGKQQAPLGGAVFPATLTLGQNTLDVDGKAIKLAPGMNVTAEIKTGRRRVIEYLLSPVQSHASESLRER